MSKNLLPGLALLAGLWCADAPLHAQGRKEPLVDKVKKSIDLGVKFLRHSQKGNGGWEVNLPSVEFEGGWTSLALLALLNSGVPADDRTVRDGLKFLRSLEPTRTYVVALQTMVLVEAGKIEDAERIQRNVKWLLDARVIREGVLQGWSYGKGPSPVVDNSNSQYALLGLWAGRQGGVKIQREVWEQIRDFYLRTQQAEGSWVYSNSGGPAGPSLTMTAAGVCGLLIASMELNPGREQIALNGVAVNCGVYNDNPAIARGLSWISGPRRDRFQLELPQRTFYNIYGIERVGRLSGLRFLGDHDWYREGCEFLVGFQRPEGAWTGSNSKDWDQWPVVSTSFALLYLSKGRTPVLISKLVHYPRTLAGDDGDWNNDRNDLAHLVDFSSKSLFKNLPLGWQTFDMTRASERKKGANLTEDELLDITSDLLQSPILYFNGHKSPLRRFTDVERELLKRYIDNGGFLLAEACCGSADFDQGFKALAQELWPDSPLEPLDPNHPVWTSFHMVKPGQPFKLMGISLGCKTVLVYSPQDLSCQWESNNHKSVLGELAFKLGANIVAYATGMEPPRPKLTHVELPSDKDETTKIPRGYFKAAQLKHRGDWQPAPRAMRNLMDHLRRPPFGMDVALKTENLAVNSKNVIDYKFLYMHGRSEFTFAADEVKYLRFNLETGGLLLADACCGKAAFDTSFRKFVKVVFPEHKLVEVPANDPLFGKELNREAKLDEQTIKCRREVGGIFRNVPPLLEGIKIDNRWVLLYSKYDLGCALERHNSSDCLGYDHDSAKRIAGAAVLYLMDLQ